MKNLFIPLIIVSIACSCQSGKWNNIRVEHNQHGLTDDRVYTRNNQKIMEVSKLIAPEYKTNDGQSFTKHLTHLTLSLFCNDELVYELRFNRFGRKSKVIRIFNPTANTASVSEHDTNGDGLPTYIIVSTPEIPRKEIIVRDYDGNFIPISQQKLDYLQNQDRTKGGFRTILSQDWLLGKQ
jgi:hypothetical protein